MRKIMITVSLLAAASVGQAQDGTPAESRPPKSGFSKQVEVTREYTPEVEQARKLDFAPRMSDTASLRPQVSYSIQPKAGRTEPISVPIRPAQLAYGNYRTEKPFLLQFGGGWPGQSALDFYGSTGDRATFDAGFALHHTGQYAKLDNSLGTENSALTLLNSLSGFVDKRFNRLHLNVEAGYDNRLYDAYGTFMPDWIPAPYTTGYVPRHGYSSTRSAQAYSETGTIPRLGYGNAYASAWFGHTFQDLSRLNFRVGLAGSYFYDNGNAGQTDYRVQAALGKRFGARHTVTLDAEFKGIAGSGGIREYDNTVVCVRPRYRLHTKKFTLGVGMDYVYDRQADYLNNLFPYATLSLDALKGHFVPYLTFDGGMKEGSFAALSRLNPYLMGNSWLPDQAVYNGTLGIAGSVANVFTYDVYTGFRAHINYPIFVNYYAPGNTHRFQAFRDDLPIWVVGLNVEAQLARGLTFRMDGILQLSGMEDSYETGIPLFNIAGTLKYELRDRFSIALRVEGIGQADYSVWADTGTQRPYRNIRDQSTPATVDVGLRAEVKLAPRFWLYAEGNNLANREIWIYNHYRAVGINASLGLRMAF